MSGHPAQGAGSPGHWGRVTCQKYFWGVGNRPTLFGLFGDLLALVP
jgi:hypothetical protein